MYKTTAVWVVLAACVLSSLGVHAHFGCGPEKHEGKWQHNPARGLLAAGFAVLGVSVLSKSVVGFKGTTDYSSMGGQGSSHYLKGWVIASLVFGALTIAGITKLEGYDDRHAMGASLTVSLLIGACALHMAGAVAAWYAYGYEEKNSAMTWISFVCLLAAWSLFPPVIHYSLDSDMQHIVWFGFAGLANAFMPFLHDGQYRGSEGYGHGAGWVGILSCTGIALVATAIQAGPCHTH